MHRPDIGSAANGGGGMLRESRSALSRLVSVLRLGGAVGVALAIATLLGPTAVALGADEEAARLEVSSYQREFSVAAEVAEERLELQRKGAGIVELLEDA